MPSDVDNEPKSVPHSIPEDSPSRSAASAIPKGRFGNAILNLAAIPLLVAAVTSYVTSTFVATGELRLKAEESKRARYEELVTALSRGYFGTHLSPEERMKNKALYFEESYRVWLYGSDEVIRCINEFSKRWVEFEKARTPESGERVRHAVERLILSMRLDVRGKTSLSSSDVITGNVQ